MTAGGSPPHQRPHGHQAAAAAAAAGRTPLTRNNSAAGALLTTSMAEKVRESYQKHSRNISAVSDISVTLAEPLRRDSSAEIRCVLLCDSEVERACLFEAVGRCLTDGESAIGAVTLVQHHWEQPTSDYSSPDDKFCVPLTSASFGAGHHQTLWPSQTAPGSPYEGYFRFAMNGIVYRLMLLSKDRQNLLKIYSYDVLLVGMQVTAAAAGQVLDRRIWEFEWKRLERHARKAVAPPILLGYFRDVLKLGTLSSNGGVSSSACHGELSLKRTLEESKTAVRKAGLEHHAIPRAVDFVTGTSKQLENLFSDVSKLFHQPGFVLQQCAYVNNQAHFCKIVENPNLSEEDMLYRCETTGDNPIMIAAKMRHKDLVSAVLRSPRFLNANGDSSSAGNVDLLRNVIHSRNYSGQSLLAMVALQGIEYMTMSRWLVMHNLSVQ